ncbi:MAG: hypothetical protein QW227_01380 [Candidatus Aenigmatarchaeota archaeon]
MAETYLLSWDGSRFVNDGKVRIDRFGNRYMEFSDGKTVLVWRRDDLEIDHNTGICKPRDVSKKPLRVMAAPTRVSTAQPQQ